MSSRKNDADFVTKRLSTDVVGQQLKEIEHREYDWVFIFSNEMRLRIACFWRIISEGRLAYGHDDDGQQFGLPAPVDGIAKSKQLLQQSAVQEIAVRDDTGDLIFVFENGSRLEVLNNSSGYEGWELYQPPYGQHFQVVAMGGGQLAIWSADAPKSDDGRSLRIVRAVK